MALNLTGNEFNQAIVGNAGANILIGGGSDVHQQGTITGDYMFGYGGNDIYFVASSHATGNTGSNTTFTGDRAYESEKRGFDTVYASGDYELFPASEIEVLETTNRYGTDPINLTGNLFTQTIIGNDGDNILDGGRSRNYSPPPSNFVTLSGPDVIYGLGGADTFCFSNVSNDIIMDYTSGTDRVTLLAYVFRDRDGPVFTPGAFDPTAFVQGTGALDANDRLIYYREGGWLFFDPDGTGPETQRLFATFVNLPDLTAADITVI